MASLSLREIVYDSPDYHQSVALRQLILRQPLNLTFTPADLAHDSTDIHLAAFTTPADNATELVATLVLQPLTAHSADTQQARPAIKMRQVAVAEHTQGRGIGRKLVGWSEEVARERGFDRMVLHARKPAVGFYTALGYQCVGDEFIEVGIPHQRMEKALK